MSWLMWGSSEKYSLGKIAEVLVVGVYAEDALAKVAVGEGEAAPANGHQAETQMPTDHLWRHAAEFVVDLTMKSIYHT